MDIIHNAHRHASTDTGVVWIWPKASVYKALDDDFPNIWLFSDIKIKNKQQAQTVKLNGKYSLE